MDNISPSFTILEIIVILLISVGPFIICYIFYIIDYNKEKIQYSKEFDIVQYSLNKFYNESGLMNYFAKFVVSEMLHILELKYYKKFKKKLFENIRFIHITLIYYQMKLMIIKEV